MAASHAIPAFVSIAGIRSKVSYARQCAGRFNAKELFMPTVYSSVGCVVALGVVAGVSIWAGSPSGKPPPPDKHAAAAHLLLQSATQQHQRAQAAPDRERARAAAGEGLRLVASARQLLPDAQLARLGCDVGRLRSELERLR
jgi:hypothetical protein